MGNKGKGKTMRFSKGKGKGKFRSKGKGQGKGGGKPKVEDKHLAKLREIDSERKGWISGLGKNFTSWKKLREHFTSVGKPKVALMPKGRACVAFESAEDAT